MNENPTSHDLLDDPAIQEADAQAVQDYIVTGKPVDPAVAARVRARSDRAREATFRRIGYVNGEEFRRPSVDDE